MTAFGLYCRLANGCEHRKEVVRAIAKEKALKELSGPVKRKVKQDDSIALNMKQWWHSGVGGHHCVANCMS